MEKKKTIDQKKEELVAVNKTLSAALKDYTKIDADLIARVYADLTLEDYKEYRDEYLPIIMSCFQFEATKLREASGINKDERIDNPLKGIAGQFLISVFNELKINESGVVLFLITTANYISNTTLLVMEKVAPILKTNVNLIPIIVRVLKNYLEQGGMQQPGDKQMTPFTPQKRERIAKLVETLEGKGKTK